MVQEQSPQKNLENPHLNKQKLGMVAHIWNPAMQEAWIGGSWSDHLDKRLFMKNNLKQKGLEV
jgi:hypothetical protein